MLHGCVDPVVRRQQSVSLKQVLESKKVPKVRRVFEDEGHPIDQTRRWEVHAKIRVWFTKRGVLQP